MIQPTRVGIIGCGNISNAYFSTNAKFSFFDIVACADLNIDAARAKAQEWNIARACTVDELLADSEIDFVINLTIPQAHGPVMLRCLENGKSVYTEKPFTVTREEAQQIIAIAQEKNLRVGSAPDTFLGGGHQTARRLIDEGAIGEPVSATAFCMGRGHEGWHPSPEFYYKAGGGPMFDMGPYYLTDLVQLMGPVKTVSGFTRITFPQRTITSQPLAGTVMNVDVPTHISGSMEFHNGAIATVVMSFDVPSHTLPPIQIHGTEGSLVVPDPNGFGGVVELRRIGKDPEEIPLSHGYTDNARGVGMADMALAMQSGRDHRCNERVAYHVLDLMHAFHDSSDEKRHIELESTCERPAALPVGLTDGELDTN
ncbi:MAG TPA: Gfo/Idh/MocA family oxidoreductase [Abditibacteriaceae bacterium]|jgi:predicted dehydrogenase